MRIFLMIMMKILFLLRQRQGKNTLSSKEIYYL